MCKDVERDVCGGVSLQLQGSCSVCSVGTR